MDGPTCNSNSTKMIQARGESASVQELDPRTYPSLLDKLQAPRLSNLGRKQHVHANPPPVGKKRDPVGPCSFKLSARFFCIYASRFWSLGRIIVRIMGQNKTIIG